MSAQIGKFFTGTSGYPIDFLLTGLTNSDLSAIQTMALTVTRPDETTFTGTPVIFNGAAQYIVAVGDLTLPKTYLWELIITSGGGRILAVRGSFQVEQNPTD
jgi:hypothetical protein